MVKKYLNQFKEFASEKIEEIKSHPLTEATTEFINEVKKDFKDAVEDYKELSKEKADKDNIEYDVYNYIDVDLVKSLPHNVYLELEKGCRNLPYQMSLVEYMRFCRFCYDNRGDFVETSERTYLQNPDIELRIDHSSGIGRGLTAINKKSNISVDITDYSKW